MLALRPGRSLARAELAAGAPLGNPGCRLASGHVAAAPLAPQPVAVEHKVLERDDGISGDDPAAAEHRERLLGRNDRQADVLVLAREAVDAAALGRRHLADERVHALCRAAGAGGVEPGEVEPAELEAALLLHLALRRRLDRLAVLVEDAGHGLEQPGLAAPVDRAGAELLDQHDTVRPRIVGQDRHRLALDEDLALQFRAHATAEQLVPHARDVELEKAVVDALALDDLDPALAHAVLR